VILLWDLVYSSIHPEILHLSKVSLMSRAIDELVLCNLLFWVRKELPFVLGKERTRVI
jgi:hypothetical protein